MMLGTPIRMSIRRMMNMSTAPPKYAETLPTAMPMICGMMVASTAMSSEMRPPIHTRVHMSRPSASVPNQCTLSGAALACARSLVM